MLPARHPLLRLVVVALALTGCAGASASGRAGKLTAGERSERAAVLRARADSVRLPYTPADVRFMSTMIGHHAQAIEMSNLVPTNAGNASIKTLALRIINAQTDEIHIMQNWLRVRLQPVPDAKPMAMTMVMDGHAHEMLMPGMLTDPQMKALAAARGFKFDSLFLTGMIQHHRGAVSMVTELFESPGAGQDESVFKFAADVNVDQTTEIARMERMLIMLIIEKP